MKVCNNKDLGVNGHRCRLPTCLSICMLPGVLPTGTALRMKSSHWMGLQKWRMLVTKCLPCCTSCPRAFAPWLLHLVSIRIAWDCQKAFSIWLLVVCSITAWTRWHGHQDFKAWLSETTSIRTWTKCYGQQAFKVWLLEYVLIRGWTRWCGQQAFKVWL